MNKERERTDFKIEYDDLKDLLRIKDKKENHEYLITPNIILDKILNINLKEIEYED